MTWAMYDGLAAACAEINENSRIRVAVLRGAGGKAFVAGTDIALFPEFANGDDGSWSNVGSSGSRPRSFRTCRVRVC